MSTTKKTTISVVGIVIGVISGCLSFWYFETKTDRAEAYAISSRVYVLEEAVRTIKDDNSIIKEDIKEILKAVK